MNHEVFQLACDANKVLYALEMVKETIKMPKKAFRQQHSKARAALEISVRELTSTTLLVNTNESLEANFKQVCQEFLMQAATDVDWSRYFDYVVRKFFIVKNFTQATNTGGASTIVTGDHTTRMLGTLVTARKYSALRANDYLQNGRYLSAIHKFSSLSRNSSWLPLFLRLLKNNMAKAEVLAKFFQEKMGTRQGQAQFADKANSLLQTNRYTQVVSGKEIVTGSYTESLYSLNLVFDLEAILRNPRFASLDSSALSPVLATLQEPIQVTVGAADTVAQEKLGAFWEKVAKLEQDVIAAAEQAKKKAANAAKLKAQAALSSAIASLEPTARNALKELSAKELQVLIEGATQSKNVKAAAKPRIAKRNATTK